MPKTPILRQNKPPVAGKVLRIEVVQANTIVTVGIASREFYGLWTHWDGNHTRPHFEGRKKCPGCEKGQPKRWKGLLHVVHPVTGKQFFIELTPTSASELMEQATERCDFRGAMVALARTKTHKRSTLAVTLCGEWPEGKDLPEPVDPWPSLARIWGITEQD